MGASKRSNYSTASKGRHAGAEAARNLGVVLGLGGLSFFLGFFVLSRMVPDKHDASGIPPVAAATTQNVAAPASTPSAPTPAPKRSEPSPSVTAPSKRNDNGPALEPDMTSATQTPRNLENTAKPATPDNANTANPADNPDAPGGTAPDASSANGVHGANSVNGEATAASGTGTRPVRSRRAPSGTSVPSGEKADNGGFSQEDQKPSRIDRDNPSDTSPRDRAHEETSSTSRASREGDKSGETDHSASAATNRRARYSVRGSAYSRREAAEREVRRITDLGLDATVVPITTEDGTTVYRVQQGVYRYRANAEKARAKLSENGVEAEIVKSRD